MITARTFAGKHYAVYGLARSGLATAEALLASGARLTAWDDGLCSGEGRSPGVLEGLDPGLRRGAEIADLNSIDLSQFDSLVVTPGLPLNRHPIVRRAVDAGVEIIGDIELFARARPELPRHKVIGITGTNGKSTTTALVHHMLKTAGVPTTMGGNIGLPILAQDPLPEGGVYVLELSSYQIDLTQSLDCDVAVLLNITPDHLDRYESFDAYRKSKMRLFRMQSADHQGIIIEMNEEIDLLRDEWKPGEGPGSWAFTPGVLNPAEQHKWPALQGEHNFRNANAAEWVAKALQSLRHPTRFDRKVLWGPGGALETFPGLPHRMERIREKDGVLFVNDSKATNPTAAAPALAAFQRIRWICGGQAKSDSLDECAPHFGHVRKAYTIGEASELFARLLSPHMSVAECQTLERALRAAAGEAEAGDTVLLSPACASFDQFRDFEDRGDRFRELVGAL